MNNQNSPEQIADTFYQAFQRRDAEIMASLYNSSAEFFDPVFRNLNATDVKDMWRMLCLRATDLEVEYKILESSPDSVRVVWEAHYTFVKTGRRVHNRVRTELNIRNGKIIAQKDLFSVWKWSAQAFGVLGVIYGGLPLFQNWVHKNALKGLRKFQSIS